MATIPEQRLVIELTDMLEDYAHRQAELLGCLRALRVDLLALRAETEMQSPGRPKARESSARSVETAVSTRTAHPLVSGATPTNIPLQGHDTSPERPDVTVGSPGHAPRRDYNYFAELDAKLACLRRTPAEAPL